MQGKMATRKTTSGLWEGWEWLARKQNALCSLAQGCLGTQKVEVPGLQAGHTGIGTLNLGQFLQRMR